MEALFEARQDKRDWVGPTLAFALHGLLLLLAIWYVANRPSLQQTAIHALPVELVLGGSMGQSEVHPAARLQVATPHPVTAAPVPEAGDIVAGPQL